MFAEVQVNYFVLRAWKENPLLTKRQIGVLSSWKDEDPENDLSLTQREVRAGKDFLRQHAQRATTTYFQRNAYSGRVLNGRGKSCRK